MTSIRELRFFSTVQHHCSYLEDQQASTLFVDPQLSLDTTTYTELGDLGFRRSGNFVYRPNCKNCTACIPVRIPVACFQPNRTQRRVARQNTDLHMRLTSPGYNEERYALYERYISNRHSNGDMYPPSKEQFESFLLSTWSDSTFIEFRLEDRLIAVAVSDWLCTGISATYTFYDPDFPERSLGTNAILWQIEICRHQGLDSVYLGYWIRQSQKMKYKSSFRPMEILIGHQWLKVH